MIEITDLLAAGTGEADVFGMSAGTANFVAVCIAVGTAALNIIGMLIQAYVKPSDQKLFKDHFAEIRRMNKQTEKNVNTLQTLLDKRVHEVQLTLARIEGQGTPVKGTVTKEEGNG